MTGTDYTPRRAQSWKERGRVDTRRGGDRHKPRPEHDNRPRPGRRRTRGYRGAAVTATFAGLDGESIEGRYVLLAAVPDDGDGWTVENRDGLSTRECLTFLTELPKSWRCWGFAFGYDVNMMLVDLTMPQVTRLYETGQLYWREFRIAYTPGKRLQVTKYAPRRDENGKRVIIGTVTVWDMFPWIQSSFAKWIRKWELATDAEYERIESMKAQRSTFAEEDFDAIRRYCISECRYLAAGARRLVQLIADAGISTSSYYSPATISKSMMRRENVNAHRAEPPAELARAIEQAYIGGRSEVSRTGPIAGPIYQYDIRSAYPAAAVSMPCLAHGYWREHKNKRRRVQPWSLVRVTWKPKVGEPRPVWGPFPKRPRTGSLRWPRHGTTWVWGVEYLAARRFAQIEVKSHWEFVPGCLHKPFAYLADTYEVRKQRQAAGDPTEFVLKLALNATYGSLAEHPHRGRGGEWEEPKFRCLAWAGWITAATRARLLDVLTDDVVLLATDGIISTAPLDVPADTMKLGDWERGEYDEIFVAGSGIYFGRRGDEWVTTRTRGFESGQLNRERFVALWDTDGRVGEMEVERARFIGMGTALHRIHGFYPPHARLWRQFVTEVAVKSLNVEPRREWLTDDVHDGRSVAPSLKTHNAVVRQDRARLATLHEEYERLHKMHAAFVADTKREPPPERNTRQRRKWLGATRMAEAMVPALEEKLLLLASMIHHAETQHPLFFDEDDPMV